MKTNQDFNESLLTSGKNIPCWYDGKFPIEKYSVLNENLDTDVVIVGGGISGCSVGYNLVQAGFKVVIIEDGLIGSGETGRTTAQLTTALEDRYYEMEELFGEQDTKLIAESHKAAIDYVESIVKKENIDCNFERVNGYLFRNETDNSDSLIRENIAATKAGINITPLVQVPGIPSELGSLCFADQAQFHPIKYILGLCKIIESKGGQIFNTTHASEIDYTGITTKEGFKVKAKHIVIATNAPVNDKYSIMLKQWAYRSYVIAALIKKNILPRAMWWDTGDHTIKESMPYHYVRLHEYNDSFDLLITGGEDHPVGHDMEISPENRYERLEKWTRKRFPIGQVVSKWSGEVLVPMDALAYIGRNPWDRDNVYIITGDCGIGMTHATIGGLLIADLIAGKENKWEKIYSPKRFTLKSSGSVFRMLKEDLISVIKKWLYTDISKADEIKSEEAKIIEIEGNKYGAFRDKSGFLHVVSAECTHLKCMVVWNGNEQSWDCPCHGSRFTYTGQVINGPANEDLPAYSPR